MDMVSNILKQIIDVLTYQHHHKNAQTSKISTLNTQTI